MSVNPLHRRIAYGLALVASFLAFLQVGFSCKGSFFPEVSISSKEDSKKEESPKP